MSMNTITSKELNYLTGHVKNESLLTHLCTQAAMECSEPQLSEFFASQAEARSRNLEQLAELIQKHAGLSH